jgi:hypothetical protein
MHVPTYPYKCVRHLCVHGNIYACKAPLYHRGSLAHCSSAISATQEKSIE